MTDVDVVVASSSGWAHGVRTPAPKVVYCHNPARWLYQKDDFCHEHGLATRAILGVLSPLLRSWDGRAARSASLYLANSNVVARRVADAYARPVTVLPPPISLDPAGEQQPVLGVEPGYLLTVARSRAYKNTSVVCEAIEGMPGERLIVVGGLPVAANGAAWSSRCLGLRDVTDAQLRWLYANCGALVAASYEDFGLTPLEANAFGRPVVVLRAGGYLDTLDEGTTGVFIEEATISSVQAAIRRAGLSSFQSLEIRGHASRYRMERFTGDLERIVRAVACPAEDVPTPRSVRPSAPLEQAG